LFLLALAMHARGQTPTDPTDLLDRWFAAQSELKTWSANLIQTRTLKALKDPLTAEGRFWFTAPNRFRWELGEPAQTIAVREPDALVILYPKLKRAERYPLGEAAGQWRDALTLLEAGFPRSRAELEKQFKIVALLERDAEAELVLQPRSSRARKLIDEVRLVFGREKLEMRATELRFADGSQLRNAFRNQQVNPPLDAELFNAAVPADFKLTEPLKRAAR
jgi:outer membrane lipoprotein-sorting protein